MLAAFLLGNLRRGCISIGRNMLAVNGLDTIHNFYTTSVRVVLDWSENDSWFEGIIQRTQGTRVAAGVWFLAIEKCRKTQPQHGKNKIYIPSLKSLLREKEEVTRVSLLGNLCKRGSLIGPTMLRAPMVGLISPTISTPLGCEFCSIGRGDVSWFQETQEHCQQLMFGICLVIEEWHEQQHYILEKSSRAKIPGKK